MEMEIDARSEGGQNAWRGVLKDDGLLPIL